MLRNFGLSIAASALAIGTSASNAAFVVKMQQVGPNVIATGTGTINLSALTLRFNTTDSVYVRATTAVLGLGGSGGVRVYSGLSGPTNFGSGEGVIGSTGSGDEITVFGNNGDTGGGELDVPLSYVSAAPLANTGTWTNQTIAGLGVTPGTYVWTWGSGATADSYTLIVPEPTLLAVFASGSLMLLRRRRRA